MSITATNYTPTGQAKRTKGRSSRRQEMIAGYGFVLPAFVALLLGLLLLTALLSKTLGLDLTLP